MTTSPETPASSYIADGVQTTFATGFTFTAAAEVVVTVDGAAKALALDYDLSGFAADWIVSGANAVFRAGAIPAEGALVRITRSTPLSQPEGFGDQEDFQPAQVEAAFDRVTRQMQELALIHGTGQPGPAGPPGATGATGPAGTADDGWSPILAAVSDGARRVLQVADWTGGSGSKPATGDYIGPAGLTSVLASGVDVRGAAGADGSAGATGPAGDAGPAPFALPTAWATATAYVAGPPADAVTFDGATYACVTGHTSGAFATDLAAGNWTLIADHGAAGPAPWTAESDWTTGTAYVTGPPASLVAQGGSSYVCLVAHTSNVFATDLAAGKWLLVAEKGDTGPTGATGPAGATGADGADGPTGPAAWNPPEAWMTATAYTAGPPADVVTEGGETYVCLVGHTSGTFATDLAAARWIKVAEKGADGTGTGTVTSVGITSTSGSLASTGGPVTTAGSINLDLAAQADKTLLANISGASAVPIPETLSAILDDILGSAQGDIVFRGATAWSVLAPGTAGQVLETGGASADPAWADAGAGAITEPQGRLTLVSATPVLTSDQTAKGTIYYTPYKGAYLPLYDGSAWAMKTFSEMTLTLNATDNVSGSLYDIFVFSNAGTLTLGTGPAWSSTTARGAGAGTTELQQLNGIWCNKNAITLRAGGSSLGSIAAGQALYLGTIYCTANGQTGMAFSPAAAAGGTNNILGVWNAYNREPVTAKCRDNTASWTYGTATWRASNNSISNRISYVDGLAQSFVFAAFHSYGNSNSAGGRCGVNLDSTSATPDVISQVNSLSTNGVQSLNASQTFDPALGLHFLQEMEWASGATFTFTGLNTSSFNALFAQLEM